MSSYLDALNTLEGLQQNQNTPTPVGEWSPQEYFKERGFPTQAYDRLLTEGQSAQDNITDFVGSALWNVADLMTLGAADYFNLDQAIMGGEQEEVFADERYSEAEQAAFGGGLPSTAATYGASVGTVASFMLPWKYPKIPGVQTRIPMAPQAITGQFVSQPVARTVARALPENWFKGKVGIKGITPVRQAKKATEISKKAGLEGNIAGSNFNQQLSRGLFDKVQRARYDKTISNPAKFVKGAREFIEEAVAQKIKQNVITQKQGKAMVDLWSKYYNKRPIQDFIDVFSTRFPGTTGWGLGSIFHEALMFGSMDGIKEGFHAMDEDRPYDIHAPGHGALLGAMFGTMKLVLPKVGLGFTGSQAKSMFTKDALGRSDFRGGMTAYWRPEKLLKGKSLHELRTMSKWFGNDKRFGVNGKYSAEIKIDDVKFNFNFSRPQSEARRILRKLDPSGKRIPLNEENQAWIIKEALKHQGKTIGREMMKASLSEKWSSLSFAHAGIGSAIMNWQEMDNLYQTGWDNINKQDFLFNMVLGAWLNRHGYARKKDANEAGMKRLRAGLENMGVNMKYLGEVIPSYSAARSNHLDPFSYDSRLKRIAEKMDNMGMSVENIENITNPLPLGETSVSFSKRDLSLFKQIYSLYSVSGQKKGIARDYEFISEKDALEIQRTFEKEFGKKTLYGAQEILTDVANKAEDAMTESIVDTGAEIFNNQKKGIEIKPESSIVPKEINVEHKLQEAIEKGQLDNVIAEGRKLNEGERVEILNELDMAVNEVRNFIVENQRLSGRNISKEPFYINESNFESIYNSIKGNERLVQEKMGNSSVKFRFSDMFGMSQQINIAKGKKMINNIINKFNKGVNPVWTEMETEIIKSGLFKKDGINQTIIKDMATLPIVDGKTLVDKNGDTSRLHELQLFRNFINQILSAQGYPVSENIKKADGTYEGVTVQQLTDLKNYLSSQGIPVDTRFIDNLGHEVVYDIIKRNVEGSQLSMDHLNFIMTFNTALGRQTNETDVMSLTEFNPIKSDKANGYTARLLEHSHLGPTEKAIAQNYNAKARDAHMKSATELAGNLVKLNETNRVFFRSKETFKVIEQKMQNAEAMASESARKILVDAIAAIEGSSTFKDILGSISSDNYKDPGARKYVSQLLSQMDILKKINKNGKDVWVVDQAKIDNKKTRKEILKSLRNYGVNFNEIEQIIGNARKYVNEQIGSQLGHYGDHSGITVDGFFKKYFNKDHVYNTDVDLAVTRDNFFKLRIFKDAIGDKPGEINKDFFNEITDRLMYKEVDSFNDLSWSKKGEVVRDIMQVVDTYTQSESFEVYTFNRGNFEANKIKKSGFRNPLTDFYSDMELGMLGYLDGVTFADVVIADNFKPLQRIDIFEAHANQELLDPKLLNLRNERVKAVEKELEAKDMWKFVLGNSKQVVLFPKTNYKEINEGFKEVYERNLKDLVDSNGRPRLGFERAYDKLEALNNKVLKATEFDLNVHTEALRVMIFDKFLKGSQKNDFVKYLNASKDGTIEKVIKRFNLIWTPSAKRTSREHLEIVRDFVSKNDVFSTADRRVMDKYLGREAGKEYGVAVINDIDPQFTEGISYSKAYSQQATYEAFVKKNAKMWKDNGVTPPKWADYSGGVKENSTYDSITFISKDLAKFLSIISGNRSKGVFKPIVSSYGENTYLFGKTVFVYDPNLNPLFSKRANRDLDMLMMGTADKLKSFSENYSELTPQELLDGAAVKNIMNIPLESVGIVKVPDKITPSKLSVTILQNQMTDAEVNNVYRDYHKRDLENAVEMINEVMSRPAFEAETLKLLKGMSEQDVYEMISNGGAGEQLGTLMSYLSIAGEWARPSAMGPDMLMNQLKKGLIDQALAPYTQKTNSVIKTNWGQKMVISKSPFYEGTNALDPTIVSGNGQILSFGETVLAHSGRAGDIEFDGIKKIFLRNNKMKDGEFESVPAKDKIIEIVGKDIGELVWNKMANTKGDALGQLFDFIKTAAPDYQIEVQFLRYPRTKPNDFTVLRLKDFLSREAGNQMILNPMDVWRVYEGDYDVDMGDTFWGTTKEMRDHAVRGTSYGITNTNTDGIEAITSNIELAPIELQKGRQNWENYDANVRVMEKAIGQVQNLTAPLNHLSNKAAVRSDGRKVLLSYPSETQGVKYELELDFDSKNFKQYLAQNSQEIIDLLRMDGFGKTSRRVLFPGVEGSITSETVGEKTVGFRDQGSSNDISPKVPFRVFVKRKVNEATGEVLPNSEGFKNDIPLELYDILMAETYMNHYNMLPSVMPGRQKFGAEGKKSVTYQDLLTTWENYAGTSRNIEDALFKAVYYHRGESGKFTYKNNTDLMNRIFGGDKRELREIASQKEGVEKTYFWRTGEIVPLEMKQNFVNATETMSETGSFAERALKTIYRNPLGGSVERHLVSGENLRRYLYVEDILLNGNEIGNVEVDNIIALLPQMIKDIRIGRSNIIRLKRTAAKVAASDRKPQAKKYILDKVNTQIENYEEMLKPLLTREYRKNPTIKNLPDFNLVDITNNEDILEQTSQAFAIWNLWGMTRKQGGKLSAIDGYIKRMQSSYKSSYKTLFNSAGLEQLAGKRLRDSQLTEYLLSPKDIETIETEIYKDMYNGYIKYGQAFLYRFVASNFRVSQNGIGVFNNSPMPLYTKPNTNYKRMLKFLVKLRNKQIDGMDPKVANDLFIKKVDNTIKQIAKQDYLWRNWFSKKSHLEDIPVQELHMFHMARNNPEYNSKHLQMFQRYTASPIGRLYDSRTSAGMGRDWDKSMSFFRDLINESGADVSKDKVETAVRTLSYIQELEINNMYMTPFKYLNLMQSLDPKIRAIVNNVFPGSVSHKNGIEPALRNKLQYNDFFALMGGGVMNGHDGMTFNPSFGYNKYVYGAIKRLITQGQSVMKLNTGAKSPEEIRDNIRIKEIRDETLKSEDQKKREVCK